MSSLFLVQHKILTSKVLRSLEAKDKNGEKPEKASARWFDGGTFLSRVLVTPHNASRSFEHLTCISLNLTTLRDISRRKRLISAVQIMGNNLVANSMRVRLRYYL